MSRNQRNVGKKIMMFLNLSEGEGVSGERSRGGLGYIVPIDEKSSLITIDVFF